MNRKCKNLTLDEKLKIIKRIESQEKVGAKPNLTRIAEDYGVHRSSISRILRDKETLIKRSDEETQPGKYKRKRTFKSEDVKGFHTPKKLIFLKKTLYWFFLVLYHNGDLKY